MVDAAVKVLARLEPEEGAGELHTAAEAALQEAGFDVQVEVRVPGRGDGRSGRIDLVASRDGQSWAIELDRKLPRYKSLHKLSLRSDCTGIVVLRDGLTPPPGMYGEVTVIGLGQR